MNEFKSAFEVKPLLAITILEKHHAKDEHEVLRCKNGISKVALGEVKVASLSGKYFQAQGFAVLSGTFKHILFCE